MKFNQLITEALKLSEFRPYLKGNKTKYKDKLKEMFGNKYRVYINIENNSKVIKEIETDLEKEIKKILLNTNFELIDFEKGLAYDNKNKREIKLGKVLNKFSKELLNRFNADLTRENSKQKKLLICISKHPYDLLGQSQDRGWTSCKNLTDGQNKEYLKNEIFKTLIAYLIYDNDKNIKTPLARILIIPYVNKENEVIYKLAPQIYGTTGVLKENFLQSIDDWLRKQNKNPGIYEFDPDVYNDGTFFNKIKIYSNDDKEKYRQEIEEALIPIIREQEIKKLANEKPNNFNFYITDHIKENSKYNITPLAYIIMKEKFELADFLISKNIKLQLNEENNYLDNLITQRLINYNILSYLIKNKILNINKYEWIFKTIHNNNLTLLKFIIKNGFNLKLNNNQKQELNKYLNNEQYDDKRRNEFIDFLLENDIDLKN